MQKRRETTSAQTSRITKIRMIRCSYQDACRLDRTKTGMVALSKAVNKSGARVYFKAPNGDPGFFVKAVKGQPFHELISAKDPCKLLVDIEGKPGVDFKDLEAFNEHTKRCIAKIRKYLIEACNVQNKALLVKLCICENHREKKFSVHVCFPDVWFQYPVQLRNFLESIFKRTEVDYLIYPTREDAPGSIRLPWGRVTNGNSVMTPVGLQDERDYFKYSCTLFTREEFQQKNMFHFESKPSKQMKMISDAPCTPRLYDYIHEYILQMFQGVSRGRGKDNLCWKAPNISNRTFYACPHLGRRHSANGIYVHCELYNQLKISIYCLGTKCTLSELLLHKD